jgi:hypothetical protein
MMQQAQLHVAQRYLAVLEVVVPVAHFPLDTGFGQTVSVLAVALVAQQVVFANLLKIAMRNQSPLSFCLLALLTLRENLLRFEIPSQLSGCA